MAAASAEKLGLMYNSGMSELARFMILAGLLLLVGGLLLYFLGRVPGFDRLPGDIRFQRGDLTVYLPLGAMVAVSILLTILLNVAARFWR